jgi:hypothetical protein
VLRDSVVLDWLGVGWHTLIFPRELNFQLGACIVGDTDLVGSMAADPVVVGFETGCGRLVRKVVVMLSQAPLVEASLA